jgi:hypothetical protein
MFFKMALILAVGSEQIMPGIVQNRLRIRSTGVAVLNICKVVALHDLAS